MSSVVRRAVAALFSQIYASMEERIEYETAGGADVKFRWLGHFGDIARRLATFLPLSLCPNVLISLSYNYFGLLNNNHSCCFLFDFFFDCGSG